MKILRRTIHFNNIDPLGDGLREEIRAEQLEPEAMTLDPVVDADALNQQWSQIVDDLHDDPTWFNFNNEE